MAQTGIDRTYRPNMNNNNSAAGPVPTGATVPTAPGGTGWTPTVTNLLVLLVVEMAAFAALRYAFHIIQK